MNLSSNGNSVNVIIIGAGMYVCDKCTDGTDGYGTILPSLFQAKKNGLLDSITVVGTKPNNIEYLNDEWWNKNEK